MANRTSESSPSRSATVPRGNDTSCPRNEPGQNSTAGLKASSTTLQTEARLSPVEESRFGHVSSHFGVSVRVGVPCANHEFHRTGSLHFGVFSNTPPVRLSHNG